MKRKEIAFLVLFTCVGTALAVLLIILIPKGESRPVGQAVYSTDLPVTVLFHSGLDLVQVIPAAQAKEYVPGAKNRMIYVVQDQHSYKISFLQANTSGGWDEILSIQEQ